MKILRGTIAIILIVFPLFMLTAQVPPHPNGGGGPGGGNIPVGGGAPISDGLFFLIAMAAVYGLHRAFHIRSVNIQKPVYLLSDFKRKLVKYVMYVFLIFSPAFLTMSLSAQNLIVEYNFDGNMTDELGGSTLDKFGTENDGYNHNNATSGFGSDALGTYWYWTSTLARGGGLWINVNENISEDYSVGIRFSFSITESGYRKIVDYKNMTSDNGFYFYAGGKLNFYPYGTLGTSVTSNNQVVDIITTRNGATGQFLAYIVVNNVLIQELNVSDNNGYAVPQIVNGKPRFRFFHDENVTNGEATPGGKVYSIKIWDGPITNIGGAMNNSWTGNIDNNWNNPGNWSKNSVPVITEDVEIPYASNQPVVQTGIGASCNNLTINSNAILNINDGGSLITAGSITNNGTINTQRTISDAQWHLVSSPVMDATANVFLGDYLQTYSEATDVWTDIVDPATLLIPGQGYAMWGQAKATTYTFTGTPNTGNVSHGYTYTPGGNPLHYGFNLMGNPYPSSIDWDLLNETYGAVYYYTGSAYVTWNGGGAGSQYVPPLQGFMIAPGSAGTLNLTNAHRTHSGTSNYYKDSELEPGTIVLQAGNSNFMDELYIMLNENATPNFDLPFDAWKLISEESFVSQIFSYTGDKMLSMDQRPECDQIPLGFRCGEGGIFSIGLKQNTTSGKTWLEDKQMNVFYDMSLGTYSFDHSPVDPDNRFILHLNPMGIPTEAIADIEIYSSGDKLYVKTPNQLIQNVRIYDPTGRIVAESAGNGSQEMDIWLDVQQGIYLVTILTTSDAQTKKVYLK